MGKLIGQLFLMTGGFFGTWFLLSQIPFITDEKLEEMTATNEQRLGDMMMEMIKTTETEVRSDSAVAIVYEANKRICEAIGIDHSQIKVHVIYDSEVNAFALPDSNLIVNTGLIAYCKNADEMAGVMGHEIAHIVEGHVMKTLGTRLPVFLKCTNLINHVAFICYVENWEPGNEAIKCVYFCACGVLFYL